MRDRRVRIAAPIGAQEHCRHADVHAVAFIARHPDPGIPTNVDDLIPGGAAEICRSGVAGFSYSNPLVGQTWLTGRINERRRQVERRQLRQWNARRGKQRHHSNVGRHDERGTEA